MLPKILYCLLVPKRHLYSTWTVRLGAAKPALTSSPCDRFWERVQTQPKDPRWCSAKLSGLVCDKRQWIFFFKELRELSITCVRTWSWMTNINFSEKVDSYSSVWWQTLSATSQILIFHIVFTNRSLILFGIAMFSDNYLFSKLSIRVAMSNSTSQWHVSRSLLWSLGSILLSWENGAWLVLPFPHFFLSWM